MRELLHEYPFLHEVPEPWLENLARLGKRVTYPAGQRIFAEGDPAEHFWLITQGYVNLDLHAPGRGEVLIETLPPGSVMGWSWLFPPYRWHFGAIAARTAHTIQFQGADVTRLCHDDPVLGMDLMQRMAGVVVDRLQATRLRLLDLYGYPT
jgi:CRP-like cAMP-binding protein